jgi:hypothetical protein
MGAGIRVVQSVHIKNGCAWLNHSSGEEERRVFLRLCKQHHCIKAWFSGHFHLVCVGIYFKSRHLRDGEEREGWIISLSLSLSHTHTQSHDYEDSISSSEGTAFVQVRR